MKRRSIFKDVAGWLLLFIMIAFIAATSPGYEIVTGKDAGESQSAETKSKPGRKKAVAIYSFRSKIAGVSNSDATDMFTTALVKSGAFAVVERQQLRQGIEKEKQLKAGKKATGRESSMLTGADYIFEGTVSELGMKESTDDRYLSLGGMKVGSSSTAGSIGLDVRVIEVNTGKIIEAVNVRKQIESSGSGVSGVEGIFRSLGGKAAGAKPDVNVKNARKDSTEKALRECIEDAVYKLAQRLSED